MSGEYAEDDWGSADEESLFREPDEVIHHQHNCSSHYHAHAKCDCAESKTPQQEVDEWNAAVQLGDSVEYSEVVGISVPQVFTTRTPASVLSGHTAVVWLDRKPGCVCLSHCRKIQT